jgi:hypothetical protein
MAATWMCREHLAQKKNVHLPQRLRLCGDLPEIKFGQLRRLGRPRRLRERLLALPHSPMLDTVGKAPPAKVSDWAPPSLKDFGRNSKCR